MPDGVALSKAMPLHRLDLDRAEDAMSATDEPEIPPKMTDEATFT